MGQIDNCSSLGNAGMEAAENAQKIIVDRIIAVFLMLNEAVLF